MQTCQIGRVIILYECISDYGYRRLWSRLSYTSRLYFFYNFYPTRTYCCPTHRLLAAVTSRLVGAAGATDEATETADTTGAVAVAIAEEAMSVTDVTGATSEEVASGPVKEVTAVGAGTPPSTSAGGKLRNGIEGGC